MEIKKIIVAIAIATKARLFQADENTFYLVKGIRFIPLDLSGNEIDIDAIERLIEKLQ